MRKALFSSAVSKTTYNSASSRTVPKKEDVLALKADAGHSLPCMLLLLLLVRVVVVVVVVEMELGAPEPLQQPEPDGNNALGENVNTDGEHILTSQRASKRSALTDSSVQPTSRRRLRFPPSIRQG